MNFTTRREFLTMATVAATTPGLLSAKEEPISPIDAHVHVWTPDTVRYPLAEGFDQESMQPKSFTPEQLFAECKPHGVRRIVLIQMSFYRFDNRYMVDSMQQHPGVFGGVAIVDHTQPGVDNKMRDLAKNGVRGFRLYANAENTSKWESSAEVAAMWRAAADQDLAMCLLADPESLPNIEKMCSRFPRTTVVVDHFARIGMNGVINQRQLDLLLGLAKHEHVYLKTSAFYALGKKKPPYLDLAPMIRKLRDSFGAKRLMWATDCPFQLQNEHTYKASIELVRDRLDFLTGDERRCMLETTAEKLFFS